MPCGNAIVGHQPYGLVPSSLLTPSVSSVNDTIMYASPDSSTSSYQQLPSVSSSMAGAHGSIASSIEAGGGGSATKVPLPRLPRTQSANNGDGAAADAASEPSSSKKKQKRNKPTLSCHECVERKTKCDRGRPHCLACIKRQTDCKYAVVADLLEATSTRTVANGRRMTKPPRRKDSGLFGTLQASHPRHTVPNIADRSALDGRTLPGSVALSTGLLSNVPYSHPTASNVFGIGSEHPFANYWTCEGGLPEVIGVLPPKAQVDMLLERYFECVDPVYPMIHRARFYADHERFWALPPEAKNRSDAAFIALVFVMLALGTQFVLETNPDERRQTAEFYASAANQALRMSSYLSSASINSIQAMVLMTYFLINDNHASDGWAFAGILMRQAYAMGLHRDPNIVTPHASAFEKQQRRKLWQAVLLQDTFLTVLLSLPPSATHSDVSVDDLMLGEEEELYDDEDDGYKAVATDSSADVDAEFDDSVTAMATSWNDGLTTTTSPFQQHFSQGQEQHLMTATSMPTSTSALRSVLDNYSLSGPPSGAAQTYYPHINAQVQQQQQYQYGHQQQQPTPPPHVMNHVQHQQASVHVHGHHQGPVHVHGHHQHHQLNGPVAAAGHASTVTGPGAVRGANVMTRHYDMDTRATDMAYIRGSWTLANLVQEAICSPRSLDLPICQTARHKTKLVGDFRAVYRSFPDSFRSWDPESLAAMVHGDGNTRGSPGGVNGQHTASSSPPRAPAASQYQSPASPMSILSPTTTMTDQSSGGGGGGGAGKRAVRQMLFLTSNYFHNLMLVHASEHLPDVPVNVRGTLEAAHDAMTAFFMLFALFEGEARVWWVFNHRAFLEALCVAAVLNEVGRDAAGKLNIARDPLFVRARADLHKMIQILHIMGSGEQGSEVAKTRARVLQELI